MSIAQRSINVLRRYANTKGQDQIAAGVFETTANEIERMIDRIAELQAQLEAARKDGERLRAHIQEAAVQAECKARSCYGAREKNPWIRARDFHIAALEATTPEKRSDTSIGVTATRLCKDHPDAPHGFNRNASHSAGRYVCDCEGWTPPA